MSQKTQMRVVVALLAVASLGTTALVSMYVLKRMSVADNPPPVPAAGVAGDELFEQGIELPPFTLTERGGERFSSESLRGRVWIADFIFTRCVAACPMLTSQMARLQRELANHPHWSQIRLVSFSVNPEHDTPQHLRDFADQYKADADQWLFLTGTREAIWSLCKKGFLLGVSEDRKNPANPIVHSNNFVLVDQRGRIRGYYDALEEAELANLRRDLDRLLVGGAVADAAP